jgi:hypothetical protein
MPNMMSRAYKCVKSIVSEVVSKCDKKYISHRLREIFFYNDYDPVEFIIGVATVVWGAWVGNPFWDAFSIAPHAQFLELAPEWVWGLFIGVLGGVHLTAVTVDVIKLRKQVAFLSFLSWLFILLTFGVERIYGPATSLYFIITLAQAWVYLRYARRGVVDQEALDCMLREDEENRL